MKTFFHVEDLGDLKAALAEAQEVKANRFGYQELGKNKTLLMIFFNNSLRTRLSTQKAAMNLGMNVIVLDVNAGAWKLETERGVIMDGDKSEHLLEAIPVMGSFCDLIGIRSFADDLSLPWRLLPCILFRHLPTSSPSRNTRRWHALRWFLPGHLTVVLCLRLCPTLSLNG